MPRPLKAIENDITFRLTGTGITGSHSYGHAVTPRVFSRIKQAVRNELHKGMHMLAQEMVEALLDDYKKILRTHRSSGDSYLREAIFEAIEGQMESSADSIGVGVFDIGKAKRMTKYKSPFGQEYDVFSLYESSRESPTNKRVYRSRKFGFMPKEYADKLADLAIRRLELNAEEQLMIKFTVDNDMDGKSGDGIMVRLDEPLFFDFPEFGDAGTFVDPHKGFYEWNVLRNFRGPARYGQKVSNDGRHWAIKAVDEMMVNAARKLVVSVRA